ncbi:MAG: GlmU family protein [Flavobacteriales bacterium]|nr:GlmU family protein [Flavobacteriales bacterium]
MNIVFFDRADIRENMLPFTFTKPGAELRVGIDTFTEKWKRFTKAEVSFLTEEYLSIKYKAHFTDDNYFVAGTLIPNTALVDAILQLKTGESLWANHELLAYRLSKPLKENEHTERVEFSGAYMYLKNPWELFSKNADILKADFAGITQGRLFQPLSNTVQVIGPREAIFLEEGAVAEACTFNTTHGPIYLAADSEVMEGSLIRGPFALGEHSQVKMGAKIYGATTFGPHCKVGGEVNNSVIFGYSNKAHDGFLGNSVIGEWCNLGADSNNSNLKNNYAPVKLWHYGKKGFVNTGLQFCGLMMGDHSKCGINTMFNTGTVVGVSANIFGSGFPRNFIPSFSWGGASGFTEYKTREAFATAKLVFERRNLQFDETEQEILQHVFNLTSEFRNV